MKSFVSQLFVHLTTPIVGALLLSTGNANAKAHTCPKGVVTVEAVITQVDAGDNPGDADFNFYLRPLAHDGRDGEGSQFPGVNTTEFLDAFWNPTCGPKDGPKKWLDVVNEQMPVAWRTEDVTEQGTKNPFLIASRVAEAVAYNSKHNINSQFSSQCSTCAMKSGAKDLICSLDPSKQNNSCEPFFSCPECIWDLRRLAKNAWYDFLYPYPPLADINSDQLSDYTSKAEVFIGAPTTCLDEKNCNDFNDPLFRAMGNLGVLLDSSALALTKNAKLAAVLSSPTSPKAILQKIEDLQVYCKEFAWDGKNWLDARSGVCGKHVLLTGVVTYDEKHDGRPEIHPLSRMIIASGKKDGMYKIGAFVDGSTLTAPWVDWITPSDYNYREVPYFKEAMPSSVDIPLASLLPPKPVSPKASSGSVIWNPVCEAVKTSNQGAELVELPKLIPGAAPTCESRTVGLTFGNPGGAAWTGDLKAVWRRSDVHFKMTAKPETGGGVLAIEPPGPSPQDTADAACKVLAPQSAKGNPALRRWYRWKVVTEVAVTGLNVPKGDPDPVSWKWFQGSKQIEIKEASTKKAPGEVAPTGSHSFYAWMPAPTVYGDEITSNLSVFKEDVAQERVTLSALKPRVKLKASDETTTFDKKTTPPSLTYTAKLLASPSGFCGDPKTLQYAWTMVAGTTVTPLPISGPGPITVTLGIGESVHYEVAVSDAFGVETAVDALSIAAPDLGASVARVECPEALRVKSLPELPPELKSNSTQINVTLCKNTTFQVTAGEDGGRGAHFPAYPPKWLAYEWSDLKYTEWKWQSPSGNEFVPIPSAWLLRPGVEKIACPVAAVPLGGNGPGARSGPVPLNNGQLTGPVPLNNAQVSPMDPGSLFPQNMMTITPSSKPPVYMQMQAAVKVTDNYGRCTIVHVLKDNDFTSLREIAGSIKAAQEIAKGMRGAPPMDRSRGNGRGVTDPSPMDRWFGNLSTRIQTIRPTDTVGIEGLRAQLAGLRDFAITNTMKDKYGRAMAPRARPQFTSSPTRRVPNSVLQSRARADAGRRFQTDSRLPRRSGDRP